MQIIKFVFMILVLVFMNSIFNRPAGNDELIELEKKKTRISSFVGLGLAALALIFSFFYSKNAPLSASKKVTLIAHIFKNLTEALVLLRTFIIPGFSARKAL